jgi:signal peptidase II
MQAPGGTGLIEQLPETEPAPERAGSLQWAGMLCVAAVAIVADQLTKHLVADRLAVGDSDEVLPFLSITHVHNTGIAFGVMPNRLELVTVLTGIAVAWMLLHFARSGARHVLFPVALGLLIGGSVSNLLDRVRQSYVVDFIDLPRWPTFNLADTFIVCGVALLLIGFARLERHHVPSPTEA